MRRSTTAQPWFTKCETSQHAAVKPSRNAKAAQAMKTLLVNQDEVKQWLPMSECVEIMAEALKALASGQVVLPLRPIMWLPERTGALAMMPAYSGSLQVMGLKVLSIFPRNHGTPHESHRGAVLLFEVEHGQLLAIIDATEITAIRTAAVSGVATQVLARPEASTLAILGSGVQAWSHLDAMKCVRPISHVQVWSRSLEHAQRFAERAARHYNLNVEARRTAEAAVRDADIICTTTSSKEPVLPGAWLKPGMHINAVGACTPTTRELDAAAMLKSRLFTDRRESLLNEAGDFIIPQKAGTLQEDHIAGELGEVLLERVPGRASAEDITLFKSLGLGIEDVAAAHHIYQKMSSQNTGTWVELGGSRHQF